LSQFYAGIIVSAEALNEQFSAGKETAQFIKNKHMDKMIMLGDMGEHIAPIAGYLCNTIYYPKISRFGSYFLWNRAGFERKINQAVIFRDAEKLMLQNRQNVLLILTYELKPDEMTRRLEFIRKFTNSLKREEIYYLYILPYNKDCLTIREPYISEK
jgi:hypothetical protein